MEMFWEVTTSLYNSDLGWARRWQFMYSLIQFYCLKVFNMKLKILETIIEFVPMTSIRELLLIPNIVLLFQDACLKFLEVGTVDELRSTIKDVLHLLFPDPVSNSNKYLHRGRILLKNCTGPLQSSLAPKNWIDIFRPEFLSHLWPSSIDEVYNEFCHFVVEWIRRIDPLLGI